ncbi:MAG: peptidylprolyl isomerase [Bergeyella sp.]
MAVLGEIRKRPWLLMGAIAIALLAFLVNPDSLDKVFGKNPDIFGKVNGDKITREEFNDQLLMLQQQAQQQGKPTTGMEEQAWQILVQSKLIKQEFDKLGIELTDDFFWSQVQYDPMFAQNPQLFDEKGNFKVQELKKEIEGWKANGEIQQYNNWLKTRKTIEYRMMARQVFGNVTAGITTSKKEAEELMKQRDQQAVVDFVKVDYAAFAQKNPVTVTTNDIADYIKKHPLRFKTEASRNLGVVYFPASASPADEAVTKAEITKLLNVGSEISGGENFMNTKNDSLFVETNSDMRFNPGYFPASQLPAEIKDKVASASIGQVFGPYKEQNYYIVSKLLGKKPSDSTQARHILISFKGNQAGEGETRTKEQAKKLADSIGAAVKADASKFGQFVNLSSDKGSAAQGGILGWSTSAQPQFVPEFQKFVDNSPKGATGVVETQFGYHIINILDKKSGAMSYKVANLVKTITASDKTESEVYAKATRFIQQVQGKSFNDFTNIAKKGNYNFQNPKTVARFQGALPGVGTDKDGDVIAWAFEKGRKKGDTEIFTVEGTGDKIVVMLNGIQEAGLADPENARAQVEPIVKNQLLAKKITEKINAAKASSLDQLAKTFATTKQTGEINLISPFIGGAVEPKVAGAAFGVQSNKLSNPVEGKSGVYVIQRKSVKTNKQPGDVKSIIQAISQQNSQMFSQMVLKSIQDNADIKDYRSEVYNKGQQQ